MKTQVFSQKTYNRILSILVLVVLLATMAVPASAQEQGGFITGTVYQSDGVTPIGSDAWVEAFDATTEDEVDNIDVNADGTYSLLVLPGVYKVSARGDNWALEFYNEAGPSLSDGDDVVVAAGEVTLNLNFTLDPGGTVSGGVYEADGITPIANMNVGVDNAWLGGCTAADGSYTIYNVPLELPIKIYSGGDNWCGGPDTFLQEWWQETSDWEAATPVTLTAGAPNVTGIDFTLQQGGFITGTVYESDGTTPVSTPAWVEAENLTDWGGGWVLVNPDGTYSITGLAAGSYRVSATANDRALEFYNEAGADGENAAPVQVTSGMATPDIDFTLDPGGIIQGTVFASDSATPLEGINVSPDGVWTGACTGTDGSYTIYNVPLEPVLVFAGGGNNWCVGGPQTYLREWWQEAPNWEAATPITPVLGVPVTGIDFTLEEGGSITGTVFQTDGVTPITSDAWVDAFDATTSYWVGSTGVGGDGGYTLLLPSGTYRVASAGWDWSLEYYNEAGLNLPDGDDVVVSPGITTPNINFTLEPGGTISGKVYEDDGVTPIANMNVGVGDAWLGGCTDADGSYVIYHVPLGMSLKIYSGGDNWCGGPDTFLQEWWQETSDWEAATPVTLTAGAPNVTGIDFTLQQEGGSAGTVYLPIILKQ